MGPHRDLRARHHVERPLCLGAACLTLLSYIATAVISANEASHYALNVLPSFVPLVGTLTLLAGFAILNIIEIQAVPPDLLAQMGPRSAGAWLGSWVSVEEDV